MAWRIASPRFMPATSLFGAAVPLNAGTQRRTRRRACSLFVPTAGRQLGRSGLNHPWCQGAAGGAVSQAAVLQLCVSRPSCGLTGGTTATQLGTCASFHTMLWLHSTATPVELAKENCCQLGATLLQVSEQTSWRLERTALFTARCTPFVAWCCVASNACCLATYRSLVGSPEQLSGHMLQMAGNSMA